MEVAAGQDYVRIDGLVKRYGNHAAIDHVSFGVAEGHTLALLGPSGCGKTTMLRCIAGLETPDEGRITIGGQPVFDAARGIDLPAEARGLGIVFQSYAIWPHMTVAENVGFPLRVRRVGRAEQRDRVRRMLEIVGLGDRHDRPATQLSGGQQQRVALARALVHEPKLVLFDEALSNLDAQLREQVRLELAMLQDRLGFTAIYVTHDQAEAFGLAETLVVMNRGRVETQGSPRDVFASPATPFVARFLGLNVLEGRVRGVAEEGVEMILANGAIIHGHSASCPPPGTEVLVCVRKEHVEIGEAGRGLPATVSTLSFQGLTEELMLDADGVELRAVRPASDRRAGDRVGVTIRPEHCLVLVKN